jgi:hypothetical protein
MAESQRSRILDWLWFLLFGAASCLWCSSSGSRLGATFDEPIYILRGLECWRTGSEQGLLRLGTMPLPINLATLPLYVLERCQGVALDPVHDLPALLPVARIMTLVFWWILLAYARLCGRQLAGACGGRMAVALLAVEPCLLAHASLATTDLAVTACLLALVYHFRTGREAGWLPRIGLPALWLAASILAKASGMVFGPLCLLAVELERLLTMRPEAAGSHPPIGVDSYQSRLWRLSSCLPRSLERDIIKIVAWAMLLVFLYCGCDWQTEPSFVKWAEGLPDDARGRFMVWLADQLRIFSNAGEGLVRQIKHNLHGHGTYLLGQVAPRSLWYYFPVALTVKVSLPLLALPVVLLVYRPKTLINGPCAAALALVIFSVTCRVQIGIRLVLPLVALFGVGVAAAMVRAWRRNSAGSLVHQGLLRGIGLPALAAVGIFWNGFDCCRAWPDALGFTNSLWGGTQRGYLALSDSNYDWGQGVPDLRRWQSSHANQPLDVWYFGTDPQIETLPIRQVRFHQGGLSNLDELRSCLRGRYLAVSTTLLYGSVGTLLPPGSPEACSFGIALAFLRQQQPVDRTRTFLIYDFAGPGPGAGPLARSVKAAPADLPR